MMAFLALLANYKVVKVSLIYIKDGEIHIINMILEFPKNESVYNIKSILKLLLILNF